MDGSLTAGFTKILVVVYYIVLQIIIVKFNYS